jgi:undecaprenyl diphosphate synthase
MTLDLAQLNPDRIPVHVGLILDGNGRWANQRGLPRTAGHLAGEEALFDTVEGALQIGIKWVTAFTFSTENWARSGEEVEFLMWFNEDLLLRRRDDLHAQGVRMLFAGDMDDPRIPDRNRRHMADAEEVTKDNTDLNLVFAFNYGSRREIVEAARKLARDGDPDAIDEEALQRALYVPDMPDVDLIIRSSGEHRLSNFLLWQSAYAEFYFPGILWPDFDRHALVDAVVEYQARERRFGAAEDHVELSD